MHADVSAPARAPFLQTPESLLDDTNLSDGALRLLLCLVKLPPRNGRNSDAVARSLCMGKDRTNRARRSLREAGHWHARKRQQPESGEIRDQRLASLTPLRTPDEVAAGWAAAEEAARLGKDTAESRRLGVRIVNSGAWYGHTRGPRPATGSAAARGDRRRPLERDQTGAFHTPLPVPGKAEPPAEPPVKAPKKPAKAELPMPDLPPLTGPLSTYADQAEQVLLGLRRHDPPLPLSAADTHELAHIAGHHLLRGETRQSLRAVLTHALPDPDHIRSPRGLIRHRLIHYLPPEPPPMSHTNDASGTSPAVAPPRRYEDVPVEPDGPLARSRSGMGVRAVLEAATARDPLRKEQ